MKMVYPLLAFAAAAAACFVLARVAQPLRLVDRPDARKRHEAPVPVVGGVAILIGFLVATCSSGSIGVLHDALAPLGLLFVVGLIDDAADLPAKLKLVAQIAAAWLLVHNTGAALYSMPMPFMAGHIDLGAMAIPLTIVMIVAVLNAINMIDGLDGLAGGCLLVALLALAASARVISLPEVTEVAVLLGAAVCGFLVWNVRFPWQPRARVFMGDAGALAIGILVCWLILRISLTTGPTRVPLTVALAPVAVPVVDLFVVAFWRLAEGRNPMQADRGHSHHLLLEMGLTSVGAVRLIWLAAIMVAAATFAAWQFGVQEGRLFGVLLLGASAHLIWFRRSWMNLRRKNRAAAE